MSRDERTLREEYGDLLGPDADADLLRLVSDLDAVSSIARPPASVAAARERALREGVRQPVSRPQFHPSGWMPRRLATAVASLLAALVLAGGAYALASVLERAFDLIPGTQRILGEDLGRDLDLAQTANGHMLTIERGYADRNRVVLGYTLGGPDGREYSNLIVGAGTEAPSLTDDQGREFEQVLGAGTGIIEARTGGGLLVFDASRIAAETDELRLRLEVPAIEVNTPDGESTRIRGPWTFSFRVPVEPGRLVEPRRTRWSGGTPVTLERVVIAPSGTRVDLRGIGPSAAVQLKAGGASHDLAPPGAVPLRWARDSTWSYFTPADLSDERGEWTLVVRPEPPQPGVPQPPTVIEGGPWEFEFVVP